MARRVDFKAEVILVCNSLDAGGIERVVSTLANEWSRRGRRVCVITQYDHARFYTLDPGVHHVVLDRALLGRLVELPARVKSRLLRYAFAKRHTNGHAHAGGEQGQQLALKLWGANFRLFYAYEARVLRRAIERVESPLVVSFGTSLNILTLKACRGLGRRVVVSERSDAAPEGWALLSRRFYNHADVVTANSRGALRALGGFVEPRRLAFVPNPLVMPECVCEECAGGGRRVFLTVARLVWDKGCDVLLEAFARLGGEFEGWRLSIVGTGRLEAQLRAQAERLGVAGRVDWHGLVPDPRPFYRASSVFVLPSRVEGMPNALLEAMGSGLPPVVSDGTPGPLEVVEDGVNGLVVPVDDAGALASALARLARDRDLRLRLGRAARERAREHELSTALAAWESVIGIDD